MEPIIDDVKDTSDEDTPEVVELDDDGEKDVEMEDIKVKEEKTDPGPAAVKKVKKKGGAQKFAVWVGNIPYTAKEEEIREHFKKLNDDIVKISLFKFARGTSKGCCLIEFNKKDAYEKALKMNKTDMGGRPIKVQHSETYKNVKKSEYELDLQMKKRKILGEKKRIKQSRWKIRRIPSKIKKMKL
ncbi:myelin expression factor 2-like [Macrobrachium nipponense]|uniref:myelin expression factor 2-like n=1 Tax=Macrobrachium nipponense TaxID=159736 RepID=UPI0030C89DC3